MPDYRVRWDVDIEAGSAEQAARCAKAMQQDPESTANVFDVSYADGTVHFRIDLDKCGAAARASCAQRGYVRRGKRFCGCGRYPHLCKTFEGGDEHGDL